jgi:hypothetical protein
LSFWSIFKRGIIGSFHKVNAKYMPLYVAISVPLQPSAQCGHFRRGD